MGRNATRANHARPRAAASQQSEAGNLYGADYGWANQAAPGRELILSPGPHHVELHFGVIELASPEKIHMQYRLDDVDQDWLDADANAGAIYPSFPAGTHKFHIRSG